MRALTPTRGEHLLVYFTQGFEPFLDVLRGFTRERFVVYGAGREGDDGNLRFKAPSQAGFLDDLASCRAVISTAGFTLMTEAMQLGKPSLALPMGGQFEQELNALLLEQLGYGLNGRAANAHVVGAFLYGLPDFETALGEARRDDETALFAKLDELCADDASAARAARERRRAS